MTRDGATLVSLPLYLAHASHKGSSPQRLNERSSHSTIIVRRFGAESGRCVQSTDTLITSSKARRTTFSMPSHQSASRHLIVMSDGSWERDWALAETRTPGGRRATNIALLHRCLREESSCVASDGLDYQKSRRSFTKMESMHSEKWVRSPIRFSRTGAS